MVDNTRLHVTMAHPCLVKIEDVGYSNIEGAEQFIIAYEHMEMGHMRDHILKRKNIFTEKELIHNFAQICLGLEDIHSKGFT